ncbi:MAG: hypothetical protein HY905_22295 [Deltaproteobacteria bacterium]|nr:hypothetical protein [Deltaproteobacteria bacterium]
MRWRFPHPSEDRARQAMLGRIDTWWRAFEAQAPQIVALFSRAADWDLAEWMGRNLGAIDERIMWEFAPGVAGGRWRLVLTPEAERRLRPLVDVVLSRAPRIPGWEFYPHRLAEGMESALFTVQGRTGVDISAFEVSARPGEGLVHLAFGPPPGSPRNGGKDLDASFLAAETLLGEDVLDLWIGEVAIERRSPCTPLAELPARVAALIEAWQGGLPAEPCWRRHKTSGWTLWRLNPVEADDYPGQFDLGVAKSMDPPMWQAAHSRWIFDSRRFSRCGETFCYLKVDGSQRLPADGFRDKTAIEDAVDEVLVPRGLGCHVGGGTGRRYSYVDMALVDVQGALDVLLPVLRGGKLPRRAWILFFDGTLADEWVPVWDDAPRPPLLGG